MRPACFQAASAPQTSDPVAPKLDNGQQADPVALAIPALLEVLTSIDRSLKRIADKVDPTDDGKPVGTPYVAKRLGQTTTWVAEMARRGLIPKSCIAAGTGDGKPWKFHRGLIDRWIESR
jgi:hypothetical protein